MGANMADSLDLVIQCSECGADLGGDVSYDHVQVTYSVAPCETCLTKLREEKDEEVKDAHLEAKDALDERDGRINDLEQEVEQLKVGAE